MMCNHCDCHLGPVWADSHQYVCPFPLYSSPSESEQRSKAQGTSTGTRQPCTVCATTSNASAATRSAINKASPIPPPMEPQLGPLREGVWEWANGLNFRHLSLRKKLANSKLTWLYFNVINPLLHVAAWSMHLEI